MNPISDARRMIEEMHPELQAGAFIFCSKTAPSAIQACSGCAIGMFAEREGRSFILTEADASALGFECNSPMRQITLRVYSSLDGVGLTAAVASKLSEVGIPCNMVAAYHHDHLFVPASLAEAALAALVELQQS
jgi:hypothetical protein